MARQHMSTSGPWEVEIGYSRTIRVDPSIQVSGKEAGGSLGDALRTCISMGKIDRWQGVSRAQGAVCVHIRPATAMVEVAWWIDPDILVEVEGDAILSI
jgi:hypothetical protein